MLGGASSPTNRAMPRKTDPMDFLNFKPTTAELEIATPTDGLPSGLKVFIFPPDHPNLKAVDKKYTPRIMDKKGRIDPQIAQEMLDAKAVAAIERWEWSGDANINGETPDFDRNNDQHRAIVTAHWFREQITEVYEDTGNFFKQPSSNSSGKPAKS